MMKKTQLLFGFAIALMLIACGKTQKTSLREQFLEMDSVLSEEFYAARAQQDRAAMDSIEKLYTDQLFNMVLENTDDEWEDSLLLMSFRQFSAEQKDSILRLLPPAIKQGEIMQALIRKYETEKATSVGQPYRDISGQQPDGTELKLSELIGKTDYVLLDFWATWCGPCCQLLPSLKTLYTSQPEGRLEVLGVNCDEDKDAWLKKIQDDQLGWRHITTGQDKENTAYELYGVEGIPTTILIDREGRIIHRSYGDEETIKKIIEQSTEKN